MLDFAVSGVCCAIMFLGLTLAWFTLRALGNSTAFTFDWSTLSWRGYRELFRPRRSYLDGVLGLASKANDAVAAAPRIRRLSASLGGTLEGRVLRRPANPLASLM